MGIYLLDLEALVKIQEVNQVQSNTHGNKKGKSCSGKRSSLEFFKQQGKRKSVGRIITGTIPESQSHVFRWNGLPND